MLSEETYLLVLLNGKGTDCFWLKKQFTPTHFTINSQFAKHNKTNILNFTTKKSLSTI